MWENDEGHFAKGHCLGRGCGSDSVRAWRTIAKCHKNRPPPLVAKSSELPRLGERTRERRGSQQETPRSVLLGCFANVGGLRG